VKRRLLLLMLAFGLAGCATGEMVTAADGYPAIYVRCHGHRQDRCYVKAQRLCPGGYQLVAPPGYGSLLIRCIYQ
jgi:hypothetical protein